MSRSSSWKLLVAGGVAAALVVGLLVLSRTRARTPSGSADAVAPANSESSDASPEDRSAGGRVPSHTRPIARNPNSQDRDRPTLDDAAGPLDTKGFDSWTGDEFYGPNELEEAAQARGVSAELFRESRRAYWLTQLTLNWDLLRKLGFDDNSTNRWALSHLSASTESSVDDYLTRVAKGELGEDEARQQIRALQQDYLTQFSEMTGLSGPKIDQFFASENVPAP